MEKLGEKQPEGELPRPECKNMEYLIGFKTAQ